MVFCCHLATIENIGRTCDTIISETDRVRQMKIGTRCSLCTETSNLVVCLKCHRFLCDKDRGMHDHPMTFDVRSVLIHCAECNKNYLADEFLSGTRVVHIEIPARMYKITSYNPVKGFSNLGNTCYMNAVLAVLLNLEPIRDIFLSDGHRRVDCSDKKCIICAMKSLFEHLYGPGYIMAHKFIHSFWSSMPQFVGFKQNDAHDFFICLLQRLHEAYSPERADDATCRCLSHQTFFGVLSSTISCKKCGFCRAAEDPFMSLSLECSPSTQLSLDRFFREEVLNDKIDCSVCMEETCWSKSVRIVRHPRILSLHLKRFSYDTAAKKIDSHISLSAPLDIDGNFYDVFGFVNHSGSMDYGHYSSYVLLDRTWYRIDDEDVSVMSPTDIPRTGSYIIYYTHRTKL